MPEREPPIAAAQRHVARGAYLVARQKALIEELMRDNHVATAQRAQATLAVLEESLRLARQHLALEIRHYNNPAQEA